MTGVGMGRRPLLAMTLGWVAVVVAVAAITFLVVDRAGRGVGRASAAGSLVSVSAAPSSTAGPTATPEPSPSATPSATPSTSRTGRPTQRPTTRPTTPDPKPTLEPVEPRTASFTTDGGTVVASCRGTQLSLDSIRPRDGWRFEKESEHGGVEVVFKTEEREVEMLLTCVRGVPTRNAS